MVDYHQKHPPTVQSNPIAIERTMFEEMTGEPFTYIEQLDIYQNYTPDSQQWTVLAKIRALADFCLLLFNANEFVYVYQVEIGMIDLIFDSKMLNPMILRVHSQLRCGVFKINLNILFGVFCLYCFSLL